MKTLSMLRWPLTLVLPLIVYFAAPTDISPKAPLFMAMTSMAILAWAFNVFPAIGVAALLTFGYMLGGVAPAEVVFGPWATVLPWISFAAVIIGEAMDQTGLARRLALACLTLAGGSFLGLLWGFFLGGLVLALVLPSILARMVVLCAIASGIVDTLRLNHKSRMSSAIILMAFMAAAAPQFLFLHTSESFIWAFTMLFKDGSTVDFWQYAWHGSFFSIVYTLASMAVILIVKGKENLTTMGNAQAFIASSRKELGPVSPKEKKLMVIVLGMVLAFMVQPWTGVDPVFIFAVLALLCYMPGISILSEESIGKVEIMFLIFITGCMSIGFVGGAVGFNAWAVQQILPLLQGWGETMSVIIAYISGVAVNFLLTPLAATAAFTPAIGDLGQALNMNPLPLFYAFQYGLDQYILPYEAVYFLYIFITGRVTLSHVIPALALRALLCGVLLACVAIPWWNFVGIL
ncbi:SLC13 family permease [Mailhella massiliensis]|uniref:SLC13 family permease n=1 Tax=Mailhella massiliensis TaxID=1903261 RepID=UPI0023F4C292|nr:SLC13 family permease [Mailhella massiliensis]